MKGISNPILYYDFDCTRLVENIDGIYNIDIGYVSNKVSDINIDLFVRNDGSHSAYNVTLTHVTSNIINSSIINMLYPKQVSRIKLKVNKGLITDKGNVMVVLRYDNI